MRKEINKKKGQPHIKKKLTHKCHSAAFVNDDSQYFEILHR